MEIKGGYKLPLYARCSPSLVCDMEIKGGYKLVCLINLLLKLVCDMEIKGGYKLRITVKRKQYLVYDMEIKGGYKSLSRISAFTNSINQQKDKNYLKKSAKICPVGKPL